jgi:predicted PurR-regulated permease PerM
MERIALYRMKRGFGGGLPFASIHTIAIGTNAAQHAMMEHDGAHGDITHATLSVFFLALLVASAFWVLSPFLTSILWATIVSVATWPLLMRLETLLAGRRGVAVAIVTAMILLVVFAPVTLALITIVNNAHNITAELKSLESIALPSPPTWLEQLPLGGERLAAEWSRFAGLAPQQRSDALTPYVQSALQWFAAKAGSVGTMLLQCLLTAIISAFVLAKGEVVGDGILRFAMRLAGRQGHDAAVLAARTIRGVVLGVVVTALVQAAIGGAGLVIAGVPAAGLLTAVMLFLCLSQIGPLPVLVPAVVWLFWSGQPAWGTTLTVIALVAGLFDNVVRPLLIKRGADLPLLLIFSGVIGGLIAFGIIGLFIGPVVLTVTYTLLATWVSAQREGLAVAEAR